MALRGPRRAPQSRSGPAAPDPADRPRGGGDKVCSVRIALLSPYSWTYPGGVTRHVDALAAELRAADHDVRVLAPYDPDDELSRRLHRGARPRPVEVGDGFVSLGRTVGIPANGAVSNLCVFPQGLFRTARRAAQRRL